MSSGRSLPLGPMVVVGKGIAVTCREELYTKVAGGNAASCSRYVITYKNAVTQGLSEM